MKAERQGTMAVPCLVLTLQELRRNEVTLLKFDGQEMQVQIRTHGLDGRSFTVTDLTMAAKEKLGAEYATAQVQIVYEGRRLPMYQPLSTLEDRNNFNADWMRCVFCWENLPCHSQGSRGPALFCGYCGDAPSWHCRLCCPYNDTGRNPIRMEASVD